jgi:hypothetical protein
MIMLSPAEIEAILTRIAQGNATEADWAALRRHLLIDPATRTVQIGKYNVQIEQGQDIHIGDRIYQGPDAETLRQAFRQVLEEYRPRAGAPFQAPPLPLHFIPRPEVSEPLKSQLLDESGQPAGVLVVSAIHGLGGIGKSTLAAALARDPEILARFPDGVLWATLGQQPEVLSLLNGWIRDGLGDYQFQPTAVEAATAHLRTLLHGKAALLVVDDAWDPAHVRHFLAGGERCRALVTTREALIARAVGATLYDLDVMTPQQALALLEGQLRRRLEGEERDAAGELARTVGYLPLALELAAAQVADGVPWAELADDLRAEVARLEALEPPGAEEAGDEVTRKRLSLLASFALSLRRLPQERRRDFAWLGVLPEDVLLTPAMMATVWESDPRQARDTLRYLRDKALLLPGAPLPDGTPTFRLHDLLHDLARRLLTTPPEPPRAGDLPGLGQTLPQAHAALLARYRMRTENGQWHTLPDDGYIHAHLAWHLEQAGQGEEMLALLQEETAEGRNGWYWARERLGQTAGFLEDLHRAWDWAKAQDTAACARGEPAPWLGAEIRCALMEASLHSLAGNIPPELLVALVKEGVWTPAQGLAYARQVPDGGQRARALAGLVPHLPQELLAEALAAAREIRNEDAQAHALAGLAPHLPDDLLNQALTAAREIESEQWRAEALAGMSPYLSANLVTKALTAAREIRNKEYRAWAFVSLIPRLPANLVAEALAMAWEIEDTDERVEALIELVPHLPQEQKGTVLIEILAMLREIRWEDDQAEALVNLAPYLPKELLTGILDAAREIRDEYAQAHALAGLAPYLPDVLQEQALAESLTATREIENKARYVKALAGLIPRLTGDLRRQILNEALVAVRKIEDECDRAQTLTTLVPHLSGNLLTEAMAMIWEFEKDFWRVEALSGLAPRLPPDLLTQALATVREIGSKYWRTEALVRLASQLVGNQKKQALVEALDSAWEIRDERDRAKALAKIAPHLPKEQRKTILTEALIAMQAIEDKYWRVQLLGGLVHYLAMNLQKQALTEALVLIRTMEDEYWRAQALSTLALYLPEDLLTEFLTIAQELRDEQFRAKVLVSIVPHLPKKLQKQAWAAAWAIRDACYRAKTLVSLAHHLPEKLQKQALVAARAIRNEYEQVDALVALVPNLPAKLRKQALAEALTATRAIRDERDRVDALARLTPHLPKKQREWILTEALTVALKIGDEIWRMEALTRLTPYLPKEQREAILAQALTVTQAIENEQYRADILAKLVLYLPPRLLAKALAAAREIEDEEYRAWVLVDLIPHLPLSDALITVRDISKAYLSEALASLAPRLPLIDALAMAREIEGNEYRVDALAALAPRLAELERPALYPLWAESLPVLSGRTRQDLLTDLRALAPVIARLGGAEAVAETFRAIQDVGRWWP